MMGRARPRQNASFGIAGYMRQRYQRAELLPAEVSNSRYQACSTRRLMPIVGNGNAVDDVTRIAFGNRTFDMSLDGTTACVTDAGDRYSVDSKMRGAHTFNLATMRRCVT